MFARLGAKVRLAYRADLPLRGFDDDLRARLADALKTAGVEHRAGVLPTRITKSAAGLDVEMSDGASLTVDCPRGDGRRPLTQNLRLEAVGVNLRENGAVAVDEHSRTSVESIYAVGDVTDRINLTPVAIREGQAFADSVFGATPTTIKL